jgi:hypothetical protein
MVNGLILALLEIIIVFETGYIIRDYFTLINPIIYSWLILTVFTGFLWEIAFVSNYHKVNAISTEFIKDNTSVWKTHYTLDNILPWKFSLLFYGEYGAWADREYMITADNWSRVIESTHALFSGVFALLALYHNYRNNHMAFILTLGVSMGSQLMNSILYMAEYFIQTKNKNNINYNTPEFPTGYYLLKRPFMWVNILWTVMPAYTIAAYAAYAARSL